MGKPLVPPTPRSLIIGYVGGPGGNPVYADRVWADYWVTQIVSRLGGTNGMDLAEIATSLDTISDAADAADAKANLAIQHSRLEKEDEHGFYLQMIAASLANIERRLKDLEDRSL